MSATPFSFSSQEQAFFGLHWPTAETPRAVYGIIHGHGEHIGRYDHVAEFMNQAGLAVLGYDHYGHGRTESKRGHFPSYEAVMDSLDAFVAYLRAQYPGLPIFLLGHSMGGNFVANYLLKRKPDLQGVVLSSPWFRLAFQPSSMDVFLAKMMLNIYPSFTQNSKLDAKGLSHLPEVVKAYQEDPLVHDLTSPVLFMSCKEAGEYALEHANEIQVPTLLIHGSEDPIISFAASESFAQQAGDVLQWKPWPGMLHELHNETNQTEVLGYTRDWLLEKLSS